MTSDKASGGRVCTPGPPPGDAVPGRVRRGDQRDVREVGGRPRAGLIEIAEAEEQVQRRLRDREARLAAFSVVYGTACLQLLRAHGKSEEASQFAHALEALNRIFSAGVGDERLAQALDWVSSEIWALGSASGISRARH